MKVGMLTIWDKWGTRYASTVLQLDDCRVVQVKTLETDGYTALKLGVGEAKPRRVTSTMKGQFTKVGVLPKKKLGEFRVSADSLIEAGTQIQARHFVAGQV